MIYISLGIKNTNFLFFNRCYCREESQYSSDEEYKTFENVQSATTKQSHKTKCLTYKRKVNSIESSLMHLITILLLFQQRS